MTGKRRKGRPIGETIGGIIVGFDQQIFRTTPPAEELVAKGRAVRGLSGEDGNGLRVVFPGEEGSEEPPGQGQPPEQAQAPEQGEPRA
jgi:hypothetical protein